MRKMFTISSSSRFLALKRGHELLHNAHEWPPEELIDLNSGISENLECNLVRRKEASESILLSEEQQTQDSNS
jgi:hypothetical protein